VQAFHPANPKLQFSPLPTAVYYLQLLFALAYLCITRLLPGRFKTSIGINESVAVVGQHRESQPDRFTVRVPVSKVIISQKFDRPGRPITSDIMLLKLAHPVEFNDAVSPVCLPSLFQVLPSGKRCFSSGWGTLSSK